MTSSFIDNKQRSLFNALFIETSGNSSKITRNNRAVESDVTDNCATEIWPTTDTLFVIDSTVHVGGAANHQKILKFVENVIKHIYGNDEITKNVHDISLLSKDERGRAISDSTVALVQFTPAVKYEFGFLADNNAKQAEQQIGNLSYVPCSKWKYCKRTATSLNALVEWLALSADEAANRVLVPDVVVLISTSLYAPPILHPGELLMRPRSPIHFFHVIVGVDAHTFAFSKTSSRAESYSLNPLPEAPTGGGGTWGVTPSSDTLVDSNGVLKRMRENAHLQFAATTAYLAASNFDTLNELVVPLCESVRSFFGDTSTSRGPTKQAELFPELDSFFTLCIVLLSVFTTVILIILIYVLCRYKKLGNKFESQLAQERENARRQEEYYRGKLHERSEHEKERERTILDLVNENVRIREQYHDEQIRRKQTTTLQKAIPVTFTRKRGKIQAVIDGNEKRDIGRESSGGEPTLTALLDSRSLSEPPHRFFIQPSSSSDQRNLETSRLMGNRLDNVSEDRSITNKDTTNEANTNKKKSFPAKSPVTSNKVLQNLLPRAPLAIMGAVNNEQQTMQLTESQQQSNSHVTSISKDDGCKVYVPTRGNPAKNKKELDRGSNFASAFTNNVKEETKSLTPNSKTEILSVNTLKSTNKTDAKTDAKTINIAMATNPSKLPKINVTTTTSKLTKSISKNEEKKMDRNKHKNRKHNDMYNENDSDELHHYETLDEEGDDEFSNIYGFISHFDNDHPALSLPPVDVLLLVDASSSIGNRNFEKIKYWLRKLTDEMDISPGRSRVAVILFAAEPQTYLDFNRYYTNKSVSAAIRRMPYLGGPTFLAKALSFSAGVLSQEQSLKRVHTKLRFLPTPKHDRPQVMIVVSDGISDDNFNRQATRVHERLYVKVAAIVTKSYNREKMRAVTHYDGAIFALNEIETLSIWLWNIQKMWNEKYGEYIEREKSFHAERSFDAASSSWEASRRYQDDKLFELHSI